MADIHKRLQMDKVMQNHIKYGVFTRYEIWGSKGKTFTKWFKCAELYDSESDAKATMKEKKANAEYSDKKTKLKHEYQVREVDETLFYQPKMHAGKGRYKKVTERELDAVADILSGGEEAVMDSSIGVYVFNTKEHRDYICSKVDEATSGEKWVRYWYDRNNNVYAMLKSKDVSVYDF